MSPLPSSSQVGWPVERLYQLADSTKMPVTWANYDGTATIYVGQQKDIELAITNNSGGTLALNPGTAVDPSASQLADKASNIQVYFNNLLTMAEAGAIVPTLASTDVELNYAVFDYNGAPVLVIALATEALQFANGASLIFTLSGATASATGFTTVQVELVGGLPISTPVGVSACDLPTQANSSLELNIGFAGTDTVATGQNNSLTLYLANPSASDPICTSGSEPGTFTLSLVYGPSNEPGALMESSAAANHLNVALGATYGNNWQPVTWSGAANPNTWTVQPVSPKVLGYGDEGIVELDITNIVPTLQGLTYAYVSWQLPGYNDGFVGVDIVKVAPIVISNVTETASSAGPDAWGGIEYTIAFEVQNASYVVVTNTSYAVVPPATTSLTASISVTPYESTTYTIIATNFATGQVLAEQVEVAVSPGHLVPTGGIIMWSGAADAIPAGWLLCDGLYGTPDLRSRFVIGAGGTDITTGAHGPQVGDVGGSAIHTHSTYTNTAGEHDHPWPSDLQVNKFNGGSGGDDYWFPWCQGGESKKDQPPLQTMPEAGAHTHTVTNAVSENLPPWYALCYIMRS